MLKNGYYDRKGLAAGAISAAGGLSGVIMTPVVSFLLKNYGLSGMFRTIGIAAYIVCLICVMFIENPPEDYIQVDPLVKKQADVDTDYTTREMLRTPQYYLLFFSLIVVAPCFVLINPIIVTFSMSRGLKPGGGPFGGDARRAAQHRGQVCCACHI